MKKYTAVLLLCAMLCCACGEKDTQVPDASAGTDTVPESVDTAPIETERTPDIPESLTFGGRDVQILSGTYNDYCYLFREESTGEVLNDAIRQMQADTEERLDIKLTEYGELYVANANELAIQLTASGDASYAVMNQLDRFAIELMIGGYLRPLEDAPLCDLTAPWWNPHIREKLSLGGETYYATSAANLLMSVDTTAMYMNTRLAAEAGIETTTLYQTVREGRWTYDLLEGYLENAAVDVNGDGKMDEGDRYGMHCYDQNIFATSYITAGGLDSITKDEKDNLTVNWGGEAYMNAMEKAYELFHSPSVYMEDERHTATIFTEGRSLFMHGFFLAVDTLEEMEDDYAVLPIPKTSETQDGYLCANYDVMMFVMPRFVTDTELYGAVTEWLSYEGLSHVRDAYVETTLKYKKARDSETAEMVQLCLDASQVDLGSMYAFDYCGYDAIYVKVMLPNTYKFASYAAGTEKSLVGRIEKIEKAVQGGE